MAEQAEPPAAYEPSGKFSTDYLHYCHENNTPPLAIVQSQPLSSRVANFVEQTTPTKSKLQPRILIDSSPEAAPTEVEVQHVSLSTADLHALLRGLEGCLSTIALRFSNIKFLDDQALSHLAASASTLPLATLSFTNCVQHFSALQWQTILEEPVQNQDTANQLTKLSIRCCALNDAAAAGLGKGLSKNKHLSQLNLFGNRLTSYGCADLLAGLRLNRHLQSLDLSNNQITDWAVGPLCELLTRLHLTPEEAKILRRETIHSNSEPADSRPSTPTRLASTKKRTPSSAKLQKKGKSSASLKKLPSKSQTQLEVPMLATPHPFLIDSRHDQDYNWTCRGNREIKFLNLSYNQLSETSLGLVAAAVAQCASEASDDGVEVITVHAHSHTVSATSAAIQELQASRVPQQEDITIVAQT